MRGNKSDLVKPIIILLKDDNQRSISLAHNLVYQFKTRYTNILHNYIQDRVVLTRIELLYILTDKMITSSFTKTLTHDKFYYFFKQINMTQSQKLIQLQLQKSQLPYYLESHDLAKLFEANLFKNLIKSIFPSLPTFQNRSLFIAQLFLT